MSTYAISACEALVASVNSASAAAESTGFLQQRRRATLIYEFCCPSVRLSHSGITCPHTFFSMVARPIILIFPELNTFAKFRRRHLHGGVE